MSTDELEVWTACVGAVVVLLFVLLFVLSVFLNDLTRLWITFEELTNLGCVGDDFSCESAPSWVYSVDYCTATAMDSGDMWDVVSGIFGAFMGTTNTENYGLRPVITISKSDI